MKDKLWYCLIAIVLTSLLIQHYEYNAITKIFDNDTFEPQLRLHVTEEDTTNTTQQAEREVSQAAVVRKLKDQLQACQQKIREQATQLQQRPEVFLRTYRVDDNLISTTSNNNKHVSTVNCAFCVADKADTDMNSVTIDEKALWQHSWDPFLSRHMLRRSRKFVGHMYRFQRFLHKLHRGEPTQTLLLGGSNCHASYVQNASVHFAGSFPAWLNKVFPPKTGKHVLVNLGMAGAASCSATTQLKVLLDEHGAMNKESGGADLALLEFSINDNGSQHTTTSGIHETSRTCFEALVRQLLQASEDLAVVPIELTAPGTQFNGVANHADIQAFYGLPVLSFRDAVYARYRSVVNHTDPNEFPTKQTIWRDEKHLHDWGHKAILDMLVFMIQTELQEEEATAPDLPPDLWEPRERTRFASDEKTRTIDGNTVVAPMSVLKRYWPSAYISSAQGVCAHTNTEEYIDKIAKLPLANVSDPLEHYSRKLLHPKLYKILSANKTMRQRRRMCDFMPITHTAGFSFFADSKGKIGWLSPQNSTQSESITFEIPVPQLDAQNTTNRYHIWVGYLRSYATVGRFRAHVMTALGPGIATGNPPVVVDSFWRRQQSTAEEIEVGTSMGPTNVTIITLPSRKGTDNKVKILWIRAVEGAASY